MKILLGMSGGLDSSYSAELLKSLGHEVEGAVLIMHGYTDTEGAEKAAEKSGIKLHLIDCRAAFDSNVAEYFAREYSLGRTPNPCTVCNRTVKIEELIKYACKNGFDKAATGHYAKTGYENGRYFIASGEDEKKDQSYMLWKLSQEQIKMLYLPLGDIKKSDVREEAVRLQIEAADKAESQDICFLPDGNYAQFVESRCGRSTPGSFIDKNGNVLGTHKGIINYTVGQRRGLGIALGERMFVSEICPENNTVTLQRDGGEACTGVVLSDMNFQALPPTDNAREIPALIKIRYAAKPVPARLYIAEGKTFVTFDTPVKAVTPGQSAVMYKDGKILCGGVIERPVFD